MNGERYIRQTILKDFGPKAQERLYKSKVLVVGAGGLGIPVLTYLNAMGIGTLGIVDGDSVSGSNLHRQVLYDETDIGQSKVQVAIRKLRAQNSSTQLISFEQFLTVENALRVIADYDLVVDASDNFPTRYLVNDACVLLGKPFIYGALHGFEGQVSVFNHNNGPTYRCLFPNMPGPDEVPDCNANGVLGVIPGIVGNLQALEAVKVLTGVGEVLSGKLLLFDGLSQNFQNIKFSLVPDNQKINELKPAYDFECTTEIKSIQTSELEQLLEMNSVQLIDVRTPKEFQGYHLEKAHHIPLSELEERKSEIDFGRPAYFICQSGIRSRKAIEKLQELNTEAELINVKGGMNNLKAYVAKY
ncbi:HesA/MoeB/ThiF family protein [Ulvibacterium marinum]|uniref:Molybdopterin-synthase adenylyltransferase n=1 Tax=Ulvibacterium marinum TaxID=2419782 RepID=A0A3B0BYB2_9FLAO|nr:HesA/MoeB/ThiF family protein [Ulvibacterium marinum]RKN76807.1 sulfurtransferase [Ulvibacterium marinum]